MENISSHLNFEQITDLAVGDAANAEMKEHLKSCPQCEFELAQAAQLVKLMQTDQTEDAPAFAIAAILRSFDEFQTEPQVSRLPSLGERLRAILRLDSAQLAPAYGFRSGGAVASRQLLFSIDNGSLDLRISPQDANWKISGQILGQFTGGTIRLEGNSVDFSAEIDVRGEFSLPPIPSGTYRLRLHSESFDVEVPELVIG